MSDRFFEELEEEISVGTPRKHTNEHAIDTPSQTIILPWSVDTPLACTQSDTPRQHSVNQSSSDRSRYDSRSFRSDARRPGSDGVSGLPILPESRPVFLPVQNTSMTRCLLVSHPRDVGRPMWLYRRELDIILVHSGLENPSSDFPGTRAVLPDLRLLIPMKSRIRALFLPEVPSGTLEYLRIMLAYLGFPHIYAPSHLVETIRTASTRWGIGSTCRIDAWDSAVCEGVFSVQLFREGVSVATPDARFFEAFDESVDTAGENDILLIPERFDGKNIGTSTQTRVYFGAYRGESDRGRKLSQNHYDSIRLDGGRMIDVGLNSIKLNSIELYLDTLVFDGIGMGTTTSHVLKARVQMRDAGVVVIIATADRSTRTLIGPIRIETRGLAYLHEAHEIHRLIIRTARSSYEETLIDIPDIEDRDLVKILKKDIEKILLAETTRMPMIIPVIVMHG